MTYASPELWMFICLLCGLLLIGAELLIPGGILGSIGAVVWFVAIILAFVAFGPGTGMLVAAGVLVLSVMCFIAWLAFLPRSRIGKALTLSKDGHDFKAATAGLDDMLGKHGVAETPLRPGGIATIDGQRVDVVTESDMLDRGVAVKVVHVEGNRVVVRALGPAAEAEAPPPESL